MRDIVAYSTSASHTDSTGKLYLATARVLGKLPNFRGKVRMLEAAYRHSGLCGKPLAVKCTMNRPCSYIVELDLGSWLQRVAFYMGGYEYETVNFLLKLYDGKGCFLDVGANIGLIALPFTLRAMAGHDFPKKPLTYCIEPVRSNYDALLRNIAANGLADSMKALCCAAGEKQKESEIQVEGNRTDGGGTGTANILSEGSTYECVRIPVQVSTLDAMIKSGQIPGDVSLIKLDTDGYDLFVLRGAQDLLATARPVVFGEFNAHCMSWHGQEFPDIASLAISLDYQVFCKVKGKWLFRRPDQSPHNQDLMLVPTEKTDHVSWCLT